MRNKLDYRQQRALSNHFLDDIPIHPPPNHFFKLFLFFGTQKKVINTKEYNYVCKILLINSTEIKVITQKDIVEIL